jgi:formylglycine-generating enzyme required for sulfatase activity
MLRVIPACRGCDGAFFVRYSQKIRRYLSFPLCLCVSVWACDTKDTGNAVSTSEDASMSPSDAGTAVAPDASAQVDAGMTMPLELKWVRIPAGSYQMGCASNDMECSYVEEPRHMVQLPDFDVTETEVTQAQYEAVIGTNPSRFTACANCPVELVNWGESASFCQQIGGRLLSESEWEYSARAGTNTIYECGDDKSCLDARGWFFDNSEFKTHPVREKEANVFGLYDMTGNVWEWVQDCWHEDFSMAAPSDGSAWEAEGGGDCSFRVLRGGSWGVDARGSRTSNRDSDYEENYLFPPSSVGFRCARNKQ